MNIVLTVHGTRGDVQPNISLARALMQRGHRVSLCAPPENESWAQSQGVTFHGIGKSMMDYMMRQTDLYSLKSAREGIQNFKDAVAIQHAGFPDVFRGADLIIGSSATLGAPTVAAALGIPYRGMIFFPQAGLWSSYYPALQIKGHTHARWFNRLSWWVKYRFDNAVMLPIVNGERARYGLPPVANIWDYMLGPHVIIAADAAICPIPPDVRHRHTQVGHLHLDQQGTLDPRIRSFIDAGEKPVFISMGSFPVKDPRKTVRLLMDAARAAGARTILHQGWGKLGSYVSPDDQCLVIESAPFAQLFPLVAAVIHHGGAGTTATAARAGVPQIILPQFFDHFYWAHQIHRRGLGPRPIWHQHLSVSGLSRAIADCLHDDTYRRTSAAVAAEIAAHDSVGAAVTLIESREFLAG